MIKNYFKILLRNIIKHPGYAVSNISSLAVGMTTCILILLFVHREMGWNSYYKNYTNLYRVQQKVIYKDNTQIEGQTGYSLASELNKQIPEIENATVTGYIWGEYLSTSDKLTFFEKNGCFADNNIFKVLTFEFIEGDPKHALSEPFSVVLTKEIADKYFPNENPLGRNIKSSNNRLLKVTGVVKDQPFDLDFRPSYLVSMSTYKEVTGWKEFDRLENIGASLFFTLVTLKPNVSLNAVNDKLYNFQDRYVENNIKKIYLKPFAELHLTSDERNDNLIAVYYIEAFAIFVLILACINFINLSTANSFLRKKEIGIRKVVGASRSSLFFQYIGESISYSFISMILAFLLVVLLLPYFNIIVQRQISFNFIKDLNFVSVIIAVFLITGFLSGIYPALYLSGFQPVKIIKGELSVFKNAKKGTSKSFLRKTLVTFQFCISILLLVGTIYVVNQVNFMRTKDLGFVKDNLIIGRIYGSDNKVRFETLRNELTNNKNILNMSVSDNTPFHGLWGKEINWEGVPADDKVGIKFNEVSYDFINTFQMKMILGRNFSKQYSSDTKACIINETALKSFNFKNPLGKRIDNDKYTIIGVVKDFHAYSVHEKIPPYYMVLQNDEIESGNILTMKINPADKIATMDFIRRQLRSFFPDAIIEVTTYDDDLNFGTKGTWEIVENLFIGFAIISILIATNGLFGMISFASQRRLKEIGIRKVFGANNPHLYLQMSREFAATLIFSALMAVPSGYLFANTTPGAYKYQMQPTDYLIAIGLIIFTAVIATVYHTTKAVLANPIETLRYE
jgi:putative ABC transport system permease protein